MTQNGNKKEEICLSLGDKYDDYKLYDEWLERNKKIHSKEIPKKWELEDLIAQFIDISTQRQNETEELVIKIKESIDLSLQEHRDSIRTIENQIK